MVELSYRKHRNLKNWISAVYSGYTQTVIYQLVHYILLQILEIQIWGKASEKYQMYDLL